MTVALDRCRRRLARATSVEEVVAALAGAARALLAADRVEVSVPGRGSWSSPDTVTACCSRAAVPLTAAGVTGEIAVHWRWQHRPSATGLRLLQAAADAAAPAVARALNTAA